MQHLIWPEWKREKESQTIRHQKATSFCRELLLNPHYEFGDRTGDRKKLPVGGFRHSLLEWSFTRNKTKIKQKYEFGDQSEETKNSSEQKSFVTRSLNGASQEIKVKLNESRQLKFYQVKLLKENSTQNSAEKNFKEDSQFNELWNISPNKNRKVLKFKELFFQTLSKISSSKLH